MTFLNPFRTLSKRRTGTINIAHRGARAYAPENTLPAFAKAGQFGCEMFEIDVHMSKDGELVVHHDDDLTRCTDVKLRFPGMPSYFVSDFSWSELSQLDAGTWYAQQLTFPATQRQWFLQSLSDSEIEQYVSNDDRRYYASGEVRLPSLSETLELAKSADLMVNIELKTIPRMYPGMAIAVTDLIESMDMAERVLISSFDHEQLIMIRQQSDRIATAVLTGDRLARVEQYLQLLDADAYHPASGSLGLSSLHGLIDSESIDRITASGRMVNVWTCNDPNEIGQFIRAGVSGIISDYPNRVTKILNEITIDTDCRSGYR